MTVAELRELLTNYPQGMPVMIDGYEGGYDDVAANRIAAREVRLDVNPEWYYGRHDNPEIEGNKFRDAVYTGPVVTALVISRDRSMQDRDLSHKPPAMPSATDEPQFNRPISPEQVARLQEVCRRLRMKSLKQIEFLPRATSFLAEFTKESEQPWAGHQTELLEALQHEIHLKVELVSPSVTNR